MKIIELIEELRLINENEEIISIGTYSGIDRPFEFCIHTNKGEYNIGQIIEGKKPIDRL